MSRDPDRITRVPEAVMLGLSLLIVVAMVALSYKSGQDARRASEQRSISQDIGAQNTDLLSALKDAETGQRGFLVTGSFDYLEPYNNAVSAIPRILGGFQNATHPSPDQSARLQQLEPLINQKLAELKTTIDLLREGRAAEARAIVDSGRGKAVMDQIRAGCAEIDAVAAQRTAEYETMAERSAENLRVIADGGGALLMGFLILSTVTIFRGMTRRDELSVKARMGEKLMIATLAGIADGVIATDAKSVITFINPVAQKLTGWSAQEALGSTIHTVLPLIHESTRQVVENPLEKALREGAPVGLANHTNLISKHGLEIPIDDSAAPLHDDSGNLVGAVLVFRDISARREAERRLRNANDELRQFVDAAAHDLRSPLHSVSAIAQLLARQFEGKLGNEGDELIRLINRGLGRTNRLLDDLVSFAQASHLEAAAARPIPLESAVNCALENLKLEIEQTGASVTLDALPELKMHEAHALQLFQNLIGNAIKYQGERPPRIHVQARKDGPEWRIGVTDIGLGIEAEYHDLIFEPFKRLHNDARPGSGIGLATCKKIITVYGGRIWVESVPGEGSTFLFTVPLGLDRSTLAL